MNIKVKQIQDDSSWGSGVILELDPPLQTEAGEIKTVNLMSKFVAIWFDKPAQMTMINALVLALKKQQNLEQSSKKEVEL